MTADAWPADPDSAVRFISRAAEQMAADADRLDAEWQDTDAGLPWRIISGELFVAAKKINRRLKARTEWGI